MICFPTADTNEITRCYLDSLLIEERIIDSVKPDLRASFFGKEYSSPLMTPAFSHLRAPVKDDINGLAAYARATAKLGLLNWVGMEDDDSLSTILSTGADTVRIIKPYKDRDRILSQMQYAQENGCVAAGIDIDHIFSNGGYDVIEGMEMAPVSTADIKYYVSQTKLPFVIKGVLSVTDAVKCAESGVKGIVVSHHHGRMPSAVPPLMILPDISEALKGSGVTIFADCHIDTGADMFKALALGADGVSVGRALLEGINSEGCAGAVKKLSSMNDELFMIMGMTGCAKIKDICAELIHNR